MVFFTRRKPPVPVNAAGVARAEWVMPVGAAPEALLTSVVTSIGTVDSAWPVTVDARGLVSLPLGHPGLRPWSLDWWVGADDRWHLPSKDTGVRQRLVGGAPVVETRMRIPSGDAVQRVFGVRGPNYPSGDDGYGDEYVVVEVHNASAVPFALALVIRPFGADGSPAMMNSIELAPIAGGSGVDVAHAVVVDGRAVALLPRRPSRVAGDASGSDVAEIVTSGAAVEELLEPCRGSRPTLAVLFPVPHTATFRMVLPLGVTAGVDPAYPSVLPPAETVASGWAIQTRRGARVEVPDTGMADGVDMARATLLLSARVDRGLDPEVVLGLDREGFHDDAAAQLAGWPELLLATALDPTAARAALRAIIEHWRLTRDRPAVEALLPEISALAASLPRAVPRQAPPELRARQAAALRGLAELLTGLDQPAAAATATRRPTHLAPVGAPTEPVGTGRRDPRAAPARPELARARGVAADAEADLGRLADVDLARRAGRSRRVPGRGAGRARGGTADRPGRDARRAGAVVGPGHRAARRADRVRAPVVRHPVARRTPGAALGPGCP